MKYLALGIILFLTACSSEQEIPNHSYKPDYHTVFQEYMKTDMAKTCDAFEEEMRTKPYEKNQQVLPYNVKMDMEIISDKYENGEYTANLACKAIIMYSLSSTTFVTEEEEIPLGKLSFNY
jgi:PBP1b-binding outer membrane lipoprotein LpoB